MLVQQENVNGFEPSWTQGEMTRRPSRGRKYSEGILLASGSLDSFMADETLCRDVCALTAPLITSRCQKIDRGHQKLLPLEPKFEDDPGNFIYNPTLYVL